MNKRIMCACLAVIMIASLLSGCGKGQEEIVVNTVSFSWEPTYVEDIGLGIGLALPKDMIENDTLLLQDPWIMFGDITQSKVVTETTPEKETMCYYMPFDGEYPLFGIMRYELPQWETLISQGMTAEQITGVDTVEEIGRKNDLIYFFTQPQADISTLRTEQQEAYQALQGDLPAIRDSIQFTISAGEMNGAALPSFCVETLAGETVDNSILSGYKLTMVNIWGTFCGPCVEEMPMLEEMSKAMPEGTQLVGIVADITDGDTAGALRILEETGVTYPNLIAEGSLLEYLNENIIAFPTTVFVDGNGNVIGDAVIGAMSQSVYESVLSERLGMLSAEG